MTTLGIVDPKEWRIRSPLLIRVGDAYAACFHRPADENRRKLHRALTDVSRAQADGITASAPMDPLSPLCDAPVDSTRR